MPMDTNIRVADDALIETRGLRSKSKLFGSWPRREVFGLLGSAVVALGLARSARAKAVPMKLVQSGTHFSRFEFGELTILALRD